MQGDGEPAAFKKTYKVKLDGEVQSYQIEYTAEGAKPIPPSAEGWSATIDFLATRNLSKTITLTVAKEPHFPEDTANTLMMWTEMCIETGSAVKFSDDTLYFLKNVDPEQVPPEIITVIMDAKELSEVKLAETLMNNATDPNRLVGEKKILDEQEAQSQAKIKTLADTLVDDPQREVELINAELNELEANVKSMEAIQNRLAEVETAEKKVMGNIDALIVADRMKSNVKEKDPEKAAGKRVQENMATEVTDEEREKKMKVILAKNTNADVIGKKEELLDALNKERLRIVTKRNEINTRIIANVVPEQKQDELKARLQTEKLKPAFLSDDGKLSSDNAKLKTWNKQEGGKGSRKQHLEATVEKQKAQLEKKTNTA